MSMLARLWTYQAERFPLARTVPLLAVLVAAAIEVSASLGLRARPGIGAYLVGLGLALIVFFQMRVADEHKDYADDLAYRPERAVPRGLVSLALLARLASGAGLVAVVLVLLRPAPTAICLLAVWAWLWLMTREFYAPDWLKARPVLYLVSHMLILPLIVLMLTSLDWAGQGGPPAMLWPFLGLAFANGCVLEIGRKTWAPASERPGVESYSRLWGPARAAWIWAGLVLVAAVFLGLTGWAMGAMALPVGMGVLGALAALAIAAAFARRPDARHQAWLDRGAALWVLVSYLALAITGVLR